MELKVEWMWIEFNLKVCFRWNCGELRNGGSYCSVWRIGAVLVGGWHCTVGGGSVTLWRKRLGSRSATNCELTTGGRLNNRGVIPCG